jgi:hypothetical protein
MAARAHAALLGGSRLSAAAGATAVFVSAWAVLHLAFYERAAVKLSGDLELYADYGRFVRDGLVPYRDFAVEYPPGAVLAFVVPTFSDDYRVAFELLMLACGVCMVVLVALARPRPSGVWLVALSPLLAGALLVTRFDLLPAALVTAAVVAMLRDRHRLGWAALGAATAVKLFPLVLVPLAVVWTLRRRGPQELARAGAIGAAVVVVAFAPFVAIAPGGVWDSVHGQVTRPLQVESLGAALMMTAHKAGIDNSHGSDNVTGDAAQPLMAALAVLEVAALIALWVAFARGPASAARFTRSAAACLCVAVALGKVLSPQYLIWLVPLVALVYGRRGLAAAGLLACAFLLTYAWTPDGYRDYVQHYRLAWVVLLRDLVLVALALVLAVGPPRLRASRARDQGSELAEAVSSRES